MANDRLRYPVIPQPKANLQMSLIAATVGAIAASLAGQPAMLGWVASLLAWLIVDAIFGVPARAT